ncbi:hypothetical protein PoB_002895700 [Plakobranchus ocellatus]|uniref:F-box domain-containing protein n=1 Tax=Plakobranchus ocellatus TaxID=259542 RepID=A0AAV4A5C8_9GAST|nr:hypothetical protein PoB_002895700 [Plakobranchus ocellatus]
MVVTMPNELALRSVGNFLLGFGFQSATVAFTCRKLKKLQIKSFWTWYVRSTKLNYLIHHSKEEFFRMYSCIIGRDPLTRDREGHAPPSRILLSLEKVGKATEIFTHFSPDKIN